MAVSMFLEINGIKGEAQDKDFKSKNAIDIFSYSLGASNPSSVGTGAGSGAGKVHLSSLSIQKVVDKSTADLFLACCQGTHFSKGTLTVREAGGTAPVDYVVMEFEQLFVDSVSWGAASGGEKPSESLTFSFGKIKFTYSLQDATGKGSKAGEAGWDISGNHKL
jgi:type VI secretion system secreted protein Hcp